MVSIPNPKFISPSYVEHQNLTMRMSIRPYMRLTNDIQQQD